MQGFIDNFYSGLQGAYLLFASLICNVYIYYIVNMSNLDRY
jgi:hypothetical protein